MELPCPTRWIRPSPSILLTWSTLFFNYTVKTTSHLRGTKIQLAINNLANSHNLVGLTPAIAATTTAHYVENSGDLLNLLPGRSITLTITGGYAPRR